MLRVKEPKIFTVALEGEHRSGKGTQIKKLIEYCEKNDIPVMVVKGDGRRPTDDDYPIKFDKEYWSEVNEQLSSDPSKLDWGKAAWRLARELIVARDRILPKIIKQEGASFGVLIIDRSILSRGKVAEGKRNNLYTDKMQPLSSSRNPKGRKITLEDVMPDIIFNIQVPTEELLKRIDPNDPDEAQKRQHILENQEGYNDEFIQQYLPQEFMSRIVYINGSSSPEEICDEILRALNERLEALGFKIR